MKIAIVGAESKSWSKIPNGENKAKLKIREIFEHHKGLLPFPAKWEDLTLVLGHCPNGGIDIWDEEIADKLGIKKEIYLAEVNQWNDKVEVLPTTLVLQGLDKHKVYKGYRTRNIQISEAGMEKWLTQEEAGNKWSESLLHKCPKCGYETTVTNVCRKCRDEMGLSTPMLVKVDEPYVLYDIEPAESCKYCDGKGYEFWIMDGVRSQSWDKCKKCEGDGAYSGGTWAYKYARKLGREVHKVIIQ